MRRKTNDTNNMNNTSRSTNNQKKPAFEKGTPVTDSNKKSSQKKTKTKTLTLRTTERQSQVIAYRARKNGYASVSAYARDVLLDPKMLKPTLSNEYYARKYMLRNQLTNDLFDLAANADQSISPETIINLISTNDKELEKYE